MLGSLIALAMVSQPTTVVMIHGAGGGGWEYDLWKPVFQRAGYRVVAKDLEPVGSLKETHFEDYLRQVQFWRPAGGKVVLIGASMGGILALRAAEQEPPAAIVLINGVPPAGIRPPSTDAPAPPTVKWADGPLRDTEFSMPDSDRKTILWAWKKWRDESGAVLNEIRRGIPAGLPKCPSLVVIGEKDTDILPVWSRQVAEWAGSDVRAYRDMSHVGPLLGTRATHVARDIISWLKSKGI